MRWVLANPDWALLLFIGNYALNLIIMRWYNRDEGGLQGIMERDGRVSFIVQAMLLWEIAILTVIVIIAFWCLMAIVYRGKEKKIFADEVDSVPSAGEAYRHDPEYPVRQ